ncbi:MAG: hypothetical protein N3D85_06360, partial [Candidatus Bathyarchaeota archaeon]|nr:hypothetical protein [Candidatus Bathyarchaeota archaeon]
WRMNGWISIDAIADGYLVGYNLYDNRIYCIGKGPSATEVSVSPKIAPECSEVLIEGKVTDQSAGQPNTPAIADEYMSAYMAFLYQQQTCPAQLRGVSVKLSAIRCSDGTKIEIGTVTSDGYGCFEQKWTPPSADTYKIIATFSGSNSYGSSSAETALGVSATEPEVQKPETAQSSTTDIAIIAAVIIAILIGIVNLFAIRKRP